MSWRYYFLGNDENTPGKTKIPFFPGNKLSNFYKWIANISQCYLTHPDHKNNAVSNQSFLWLKIRNIEKRNILSNNRNLTVVNLSVFLEHQQF